MFKLLGLNISIADKYNYEIESPFDNGFLYYYVFTNKGIVVVI